jgi:hypothetical protein
VVVVLLLLLLLLVSPHSGWQPAARLLLMQV